LSSPSSNGFAALGLSEPLLNALSHAGYARPTPIQESAIPVALSGKDVIGCAATGTGKTAAFVLPLVERLAGKTGTAGLILAPTRELAVQIAEHLETFGRPKKLRSAVIIGGVSAQGQVQALRNRPHVIVATPGRLVDHLQEGTARLEHIEVLILDEADRMLDMGFKPQLTRILAKVPRKRQTMLFSATMGAEVTEFARQHLQSPTRVEVSRSGDTAARAEQAVYAVSQLDKGALLLALLEAEAGSMLVFTRTKRRADKVARTLERAGHAVARIHADRSQGQRKSALDGFKSGKYRVLVATDIAARGIDVEEISHVVNFDLPHVPEDYVHRIGRTARAAATGRASSFVAPEELPLLRDIERFTRAPLLRKDVPTDAPAFLAEQERLLKARTDPGPPQRGHGQSARPPGQPPGRHARTHRKRPHSELLQPGTVSQVPAPAPRARQGQKQGGARTPTSGNWRPRGRRR
jgi:ATP-dependent RNA helicase RhlE